MKDDLISRQAAIDTDGLDEEIRCEMCKNPMHTSKGCDGNCEYDEGLYERIMQILGKRIKPLPSAQPQRKTGRWIDEGQYADYHPHHAWRCSECGEHVIEVDTPWYKYCPTCGARMDGEKIDL